MAVATSKMLAVTHCCHSNTRYRMDNMQVYIIERGRSNLGVDGRV